MCGADQPVFHFNFRHANGKTELTDTTGKVRCECKGATLLVEHGALRLAHGAQISIPPQPGIPDMKKQLTVCAWILKKRNDINPILFKGVHGTPIHFLFTLRGQYPAFCYKNMPSHPGWKGLYVVGKTYGNDLAYGNKDWVVEGAEPRTRITTWAHVAAAFNQGEVTAYINGKPTARMKAEEQLLPNDLPFYVGAERVAGRDTNYHTANMLLNDLRLYAHALSAEQINGIYQEERADYPREKIKLKDAYHYLGFGEAFDPEFKKTLPITREYLAALPEDDLAGQAVRCRIRPHNGAQTLFVNNKAETPLLFDTKPQSAIPERRYKFCRVMEDFAAAGIDVVTTGAVYVHLFWKGPDQYDFAHFDHVCHDILKAHPRARILALLYVAAPPWWYKQHPEHKEQYYQGAAGKWALKTWHGHAPMASDKWLDDSLVTLRKFVEHVESSDYANHVIGYIPGGGGAGEWYWAGCHNGLTGYSDVTRKSFQNWLRNKYAADVNALRKAWRDGAATFDNAQVPSPEYRLKSEHLDFRDPKTARPAFDFCRYINERTAHCITATCRTLKQACRGEKIVGIYHGYALIGPLGKGANSGYYSHAITTKSKWIDFFCNMPNYSYKFRGVGGDGLMINGFTGTARLRNRLLIYESDLRTHFYEKNTHGRTKNLAETLAVIERGVGLALTKNTAQWWYNLVGFHVFHQQEMMQRIADLKRVASQALEKNRASTAEVALIYDIESMYYHRYRSSVFRRGFYYSGTYCEAARMGAPFEGYMVDDLKNPNMPDYKLYIFMNQFYADEETRAMIARKIRRNNAVAVWCYAPGYISPDGFSADTMAELTGMTMAASNSEQQLRMTTVATASPITRYFTESPEHKVGPVFKVADPKATVLGKTEFGPGLAVKEFDDWRSVYCLMPLDRKLLTGLCEYAGVHVYCKSGDALTVNSSYLMLHTSTPGKKRIVLPKACTVRNALSGELIGEGIESFERELPDKVTRIYEMSQ